MKQDKRVTAIVYALLAAVFYAVNVPVSKLLLERVAPTFMAALLYLGAGIGVGLMWLLNPRRERAERLTRRDLPYTVGMILLDIAAPILLMLGVSIGSSANASLLGNFEIVATTVIALLIFREAVSPRLWLAILLITVSSILLTFDGADAFRFSLGSLLVLGATLCWGLENNCTRKLSEKSTYEIVLLKGIFSGGGALVIALLTGEGAPELPDILAALLLGFVAYGLSIFLYVRAQRTLGAARTSAYYAAAPFVGAFLSFLLVGEALTLRYLAALLVMVAGTVFVVLDTLAKHHAHEHTHTVTHTHGGTTHTHTVTHTHGHDHFTQTDRHGHRHTMRELERELAAQGHTR